MELFDPRIAFNLGRVDEHVDKKRDEAVEDALHRCIRSLLPSRNTAFPSDSRRDVRYLLFGGLIREYRAMILATPRATLFRDTDPAVRSFQFGSLVRAVAVTDGFEIIHLWNSETGYCRVEDRIVMGTDALGVSSFNHQGPVCRRKVIILDEEKQEHGNHRSCFIVCDGSHVYYIPTSPFLAPGPPRKYLITSCESGYDIADPNAPEAGSSGNSSNLVDSENAGKVNNADKGISPLSFTASAGGSDQQNGRQYRVPYAARSSQPQTLNVSSNRSPQ